MELCEKRQISEGKADFSSFVQVKADFCGIVRVKAALCRVVRISAGEKLME